MFNITIQQNIIGLYNAKKTLKEIAGEVGVTAKTVRSILRINNVSMRSLSDSHTKFDLVDPNFFEQIDTQEKAYFLGFLYADGCLSEKGVSLRLQEADKPILDKLNKLIYKDKPLNFFLRKKTDKYNRQEQYGINIHNSKMCSDLLKLGLAPRKSFVLPFPSENIVPKSLLNHFVRGVMDGDGTIGVYPNLPARKSYYIKFSLICSCDFGIKFKEIVSDVTGSENVGSSIKKYEGGDMMIVSAQKRDVVKSFLTWLYQDDIISLGRKKEKFTKFFNE